MKQEYDITKLNPRKNPYINRLSNSDENNKEQTDNNMGNVKQENHKESFVCKAKSVDTKEWVVGYHVHDEHDYILENLELRAHGTAELVNAHVVLHDTISRCTGYNDKNGNLMFENDVISWFDGWKYIIKHGYFHGQVGLRYHYGLGFYLERIGDPTHRVPFNAAFVNEYDVVGNIFDNKELLEIDKN